MNSMDLLNLSILYTYFVACRVQFVAPGEAHTLGTRIRNPSLYEPG